MKADRLGPTTNAKVRCGLGCAGEKLEWVESVDSYIFPFLFVFFLFSFSNLFSFIL
jgi:hypothetical protein